MKLSDLRPGDTFTLKLNSSNTQFMLIRAHGDLTTYDSKDRKIIYHYIAYEHLCLYASEIDLDIEYIGSMIYV